MWHFITNFFLIQGLQAMLIKEEFEHITLGARITALTHSISLLRISLLVFYA